MKIATRATNHKIKETLFISALSCLALLISLPAGLSLAVAADAGMASGPALPAVSSPAMTPGTPPSTNTVPAATSPATAAAAPTSPSMLPSPMAPNTPDQGVTTLAASAPDTKATDSSDKKTEKNLTKLEDKVNDGAKDVVKRLAANSTDITLDDLNAAKIAVAKIDALIEIEKHLADLDKIRQDRNKDSSSSQIPQIAASSFQPPSLPSFTPPPAPTFAVGAPSEAGFAPMPAPVTMFGTGTEVSRIMGVDGHYTAVLSLPGGQTKTVHVGDKLSDGSLIIAISSTSVTIRQQAKTKEIDVKGVDKIYGRSL